MTVATKSLASSPNFTPVQIQDYAPSVVPCSSCFAFGIPERVKSIQLRLQPRHRRLQPLVSASSPIRAQPRFGHPEHRENIPDSVGLPKALQLQPSASACLSKSTEDRPSTQVNDLVSASKTRTLPTPTNLRTDRVQLLRRYQTHFAFLFRPLPPLSSRQTTTYASFDSASHPLRPWFGTTSGRRAESSPPRPLYRILLTCTEIQPSHSFHLRPIVCNEGCRKSRGRRRSHRLN